MKNMLIITAFFCGTLQAQTGYQLVNESGDILVKQTDTITTLTGVQYSTLITEFADSLSAAQYLEAEKNTMFANAARFAAMAHDDSTRANRIRQIGSDAGLFSVPQPSPPPPKIPELITIPEPVKLPATKQKKPRKQKKQ